VVINGAVGVSRNERIPPRILGGVGFNDPKLPINIFSDGLLAELGQSVANLPAPTTSARNLSLFKQDVLAFLAIYGSYSAIRDRALPESTPFRALHRFNSVLSNYSPRYRIFDEKLSRSAVTLKFVKLSVLHAYP
jgi:hypothetical protein